MPQRIDQLQSDASADLNAVASPEQLEAFRIKYLGTKGALKSLMGLLKEVPKDQKREFGQRANALRQQLQESFEQKKQSLGSNAKPQAASKPLLDVTEPGAPPKLGRQHIIDDLDTLAIDNRDIQLILCDRAAILFTGAEGQCEDQAQADQARRVQLPLRALTRGTDRPRRLRHAVPSRPRKLRSGTPP